MRSGEAKRSTSADGVSTASRSFTNSTDHKGDAELSPVAVVTPRVRLHCVSGHVVAIDDSDEPLLHS